MVTNVNGDLLTNAHTSAAEFGKIRVPPRFFGKFLEDFRVLVGAVFLKQSDVYMTRSRSAPSEAPAQNCAELAFISPSLLGAGPS